MTLLQKIKNWFHDDTCDPKPHKFQKWRAVFKTVDGEEHRTDCTKWIAHEWLICPVPEYIMIIAKEAGYIRDENDKYFLLQNIISIGWTIDEEKTFIQAFDPYSAQVMFSDEELGANK